MRARRLVLVTQHPAFAIRSMVSHRGKANHASRMRSWAVSRLGIAFGPRRMRDEDLPFQAQSPDSYRLEHLTVVDVRGSDRLDFDLSRTFDRRPVAYTCPREGATRRRTGRGAFYRWTRIARAGRIPRLFRVGAPRALASSLRSRAPFLPLDSKRPL
jgi:hypothetical protein